MIPLSSNLLFIILFYFLGSIPFALIIPKIFGYGDIRNTGSGNVGATNVLRMGNKYMAFSVLLADILKGLLPFIILRVYLDEIDTLSRVFLCHFAILGHIFPIWLKFKGGKGVATGLGVLSFAMRLSTLCSDGVFAICLKVSGFVSLSSILAAISLPLLGIFFKMPLPYIYLSTIVALFTLQKHHDNIVRLTQGTEAKFFKK